MSGRESAAEHIRNALQIVESQLEDQDDAALRDDLLAVSRRLGRALAELEHRAALVLVRDR